MFVDCRVDGWWRQEGQEHVRAVGNGAGLSTQDWAAALASLATCTRGEKRGTYAGWWVPFQAAGQ